VPKKVAPPRRIDPNNQESMNRLLRLSAPRATSKDTNHTKTIQHKRNFSSNGQRHVSVGRHVKQAAVS
jgi:hypothetical protein